MLSRVSPESAALLCVLAVVLSTAIAQVVWQAHVRVDNADNRARSALSTALDLEQKLEELETTIDELRDELENQR